MTNVGRGERREETEVISLSGGVDRAGTDNRGTSRNIKKQTSHFFKATEATEHSLYIAADL